MAINIIQYDFTMGINKVSMCVCVRVYLSSLEGAE